MADDGKMEMDEILADARETFEEMGMDEINIEEALKIVEQIETEGAASFTMTLKSKEDVMAEMIANWIALMKSYPSDGWDGAAALIASHDRQVIALEQELDRLHPEWRDQENVIAERPRTRDPRVEER